MKVACGGLAFGGGGDFVFEFFDFGGDFFDDFEGLAGAGELAAELANFFVHFFEAGGSLTTGLFENVPAFIFQGVQADGEFVAQFDGFGAGAFGVGAGFADQVALLVDFGEQVGGLEFLLGEAFAGSGDNLFGQAEALGNGQRVGDPRQADDQAVGGAQGLNVKFHAGVDDARTLEGVGFQFGVVGGDEGSDAPVKQMGQDGTGEGRAFLRVGAGAEFVEQDERLGVGFFQDADDVGDVAGEGGEGLFDGLFVADVGKNVLEHRDFRARVGGDVQAGLGHEGEQADGFEADSFAAGVGAGDDQGVGVGIEKNVNRDDGVGVEEGVARAFEADEAAGVMPTLLGFGRSGYERELNRRQGGDTFGVRRSCGVPRGFTRGYGAHGGERMQAGFRAREVFGIFRFGKG